jgi:hypothetical protein
LATKYSFSLFALADSFKKEIIFDRYENIHSRYNPKPSKIQQKIE